MTAAPAKPAEPGKMEAETYVPVAVADPNLKQAVDQKLDHTKTPPVESPEGRRY
jgi:hypothetical protein